MHRLRDWFQRWSDVLDYPSLIEACGFRSWFVTGGMLLMLLTAAAFAPGLSRFFLLWYGPALIGLAALVVVGFSIAFYVNGRSRLPMGGLLLVLLGSTAVEVFYGAVALLCRGRGSVVFFIFMLLMIAFHGHVFRGAPRHPMGAIISTLAVLGLLPFAPPGESTYVLLTLLVVASPTSILVGQFALRQVEAQRETERLRAALQANMLEQSMSEQERLAQVLTQVLGVQHDIANATMTAVLNTEVLREAVAHGHIPPKEELKELADDIHTGLSRVQGIMQAAKGATRDGVLPPEVPVEVAGLLQQAIDDARLRFPGVNFRLELVNGIPARIRFRGGAAAVYRVLDNLLVNACEGNGRRGASSVLLRCRRDSTGGRLEIAVIDDGPGFSTEQLDRPVEGFKTTKTAGTGLGLYTTESLVKASDGNLERKNLPEGGAMVAVVLPLSPGTPVTPQPVASAHQRKE